MLVERQKEMCTPSRLCVPEHSRHMSVPYVTDAHEGFFAGQSKQICAQSRSDGVSVRRAQRDLHVWVR